MKPAPGLIRLLAVAAVAFCALPSTAAIVATGSGYEVSYDIGMNPGTNSGKPIGNVFVFETNGSSVNVDYGFSIAGTGISQLKHIVPFAPTSTVIAGMILGTPGLGDGAEHAYLIVNDRFANAAVGYKWSEVFPGSGGVRMRHDVFIDLLELAAAGDAPALLSITQFAMNDASGAWFASTGSFSVSEFTVTNPPVGGSLPEPGTLVLATLALAMLAYGRRSTARR
jgi:hypothetical protein